MSGVSWSGWQQLEPVWQPSPAVFRETLGGGQAFRWKDCGDYWEGVWATHCARLRWQAGGIEASAMEAATLAALPHYLALDLDLERLTSQLPWCSDAVLAVALQRWPGLRILRQPFAETLLAFLCSSTKRISQISLLCETLASRFGKSIACGQRALPDWPTLATLPEAVLRSTGIGYRARYIQQTAQVLAAHPEWLEEVEQLPYPEAKAQLLALPGVGEKIADCVLLFGGGHLEAFPVDTWVLKAMARLYGLAGWKPSQVAQFGRLHFGPYAGYAQQLLFAGERSALN